jgi:hypothetical protein
MKKPKLYIETGFKPAITLVCANKISVLEPYLPDLKRLQNHMIYERRACELDGDRRPKPLVIVLENRIFNSVLRELSRRCARVISLDHLDLIVQSGNLPICRVVPRNEDEI